jgi:hypothetical protein
VGAREAPRLSVSWGMRLARSPRFASVAFALRLAPLPLACGDDDGTDTGAESGPVASTSEDPSSSGADTIGTGVDTAGTTAAVDGTGSTSPASTDDGSTTGPVGDPAYPPPDAGSCPDGTLPVALPGAELCAPFCGGPDDACPAAGSGDATPRCTPFAGPGGSGDACDDVTPCPDGETCSGGACSEIAFYACQLLCDMGQTCPDDMACSGIATCGYS